MKNYWTGKTYLKLERGCPYYVTYNMGSHRDTCIKEIFNVFGWSLAWRTRNANEFKPKYVEKLLKIFDSIHGCMATYKGHTYYLNDMLWIMPRLDHIELTEHPQVVFDNKSHAYIGFSHRAAQMFKIGDRLFEDNPLTPKELHQYYQDKHLRWDMLKTLIKYHFKNDTDAFEDIFEDKIIGHGIASFIPFRKRGSKVIETLAEAKQAAINFAKFVS